MNKFSDLKKKWLSFQIDKLKQRGLSKAAVARDLSIVPQQLNSILNGNKGVSDDFMDKFSETYNINYIDLYFDIPKEKTEIKSSSDISILMSMIKDKDYKLEEKSEEIGRLKQEIEILKEKTKNGLSQTSQLVEVNLIRKPKNKINEI